MNKQKWQKGIVLGLGLWMLAGAAPGVADQISDEKAAREALAAAERTFLASLSNFLCKCGIG